MKNKSIKVYFENYGCSANLNDAEIMTGILEKKKYKITKEEEKADIIIINTCAVKGPTETKILKSINKKKEKKIIATGCMAEAQTKLLLKNKKDISIVSPDNIDKIDLAVKSITEGKQTILTGKRKIDKTKLPKKSYHKIIDIIQIAEGCDSACTYCITKFAKGHIKSFSETQIIENIIKGLEEGKKEFWLTSQDNSCYGIDKSKKTRLPRLLKRISRIEGNFFVRNGMGNPNNIVNSIKEIIDAYKQEKIFKFLHLPSQTGSNKILKDMRRQYTIEEFYKIINSFKEEFEKFTFSNDIIVGYPTEKEEDFKETIELIKKTKPDILNISKFWPRPGTYASKLKLLEGSIVKERSRKITELFKKISYNNNLKYKNWSGTILLDEIGKTIKKKEKNNKKDNIKEIEEKTIIGRNIYYKPIVIKEKDLYDNNILKEEKTIKNKLKEKKENNNIRKALGTFLEVKITKTHTFYLEGKII